MRNFFGRRRPVRTRTVRSGTSGGTVELAITALVVVVLVLVLLRLVGMI